MKEYFFFFNDNDELVCKIETEYDSIEYEGRDAINQLSCIDCLTFENVKATAKSVKLTNDNFIVNISDLLEFFQKGYSSYLTNTLDSINKAIAKYQKQKRHITTNLKIQGSRAIVGAVVFALLGIAYHSLKNNTKENSKDNKTRLEQDYLAEPIKVEIENTNITTQDIDSLLDELEYNDTIETDRQNYYDISNEPINTAYLTFEDKTDSEKYRHAYDGYYEIVEKYSNKWGNPANVMMGMLTQESGGYVPDNLMQIQFRSWENQVLTAYDFTNERYQKIVLSNEPEKYAGKDIMVITENDLKNKVTNISVACVIFRYCLNKMDYNIPASIQAYNLGCGNMKKVLAETSSQTGISVDELLSDQSNVEFMNYTHIVNCGDPEYLNHVSWYIENSDDISIKVINDEGEVSEITISFVQKSL